MLDTQMIRCLVCGATNRVPNEKIAQGLEPICGRCKKTLPVASPPLTVTDATFSTEIEQSPLPVLLDVWAEWCAPCRTIAPVIEELAKEMAGRVKVAKLNIDENPVTAQHFKIWSIPTLLVLKAGQEIDRIVGVQPKAEIVRRLERVIAQGASASPAA
jgi:thioredoxin 2